MRLKIRHDTIYRYTSPASSVIQQLRLTPRGHDSQFVRRWRVEADADCKLDRDEDAFGNIMHTFSIDGPIRELRVLVEGDVETSDAGGAVRGAVERFPEQFWLRGTALTACDAGLAEFARDVVAGEGGDILSGLHALNTSLYTTMRFAPGDTNATTTAAQSFKSRTGVCQDFAHVFVASARALNIPARYVGGYFLRTDGDEQEAGHAWAEAKAPGIGWIGFDPAHGVCITDRYVRVAAGLDYLDAAPIRGAHIGGGGETLSVSVNVAQGPVITDE